MSYNTGEIIYREKFPLGVFSFILILLAPFWYAILTEEQINIKGLTVISIFTACFSLFLVIVYVGYKNKPIFFENGIGFYKKRELVRFESYQQFIKLNCEVEEHHVENADWYEYSINFVRSDGSIAKISSERRDEVVHACVKIIKRQPDLISKLDVRLLTEINASKLHPEFLEKLKKTARYQESQAFYNEICTALNS